MAITEQEAFYVGGIDGYLRYKFWKGGKAWTLGIVACVGIIVIIIAVAAVAMNNHHSHVDNNWSSTPAPWNSPSPWDPPTLTPRPTHRCTDTPGWVDRDGRGCDSYENSPWRCGSSSSFEASMGPARKHCCACGGGSTYVPPTPMPSRAPTTPRPTQPSACIDTPGFVDSSGWGCNKYKQYDFACGSADLFMGDMGSATEHCCVCGGGNVPSNTSKAPAISNTPTVAPTSPTPVVAVPTLASKDKMDSNLSNTNPFRSPTAAQVD